MFAMSYRIRTAQGRRHIVLPDCQVRPGVPTRHLEWAAYYIIDKEPDVVVHLGDFADMQSLSSWTSTARKNWERRSYQADIDASLRAMERFVEPLEKAGVWQHIEAHITLGNHEGRINRWIDEDPMFAEFMSTDDLRYADFGWREHEFLKPVVVDGVSYAHYWAVNSSGHVTKSNAGSSSASAQVKALMKSCTAGHKQGLDIHCHPTPDGLKWGLIAGSFYLHDEDYLTPQGHGYWRGVIMKNDVRRGHYGPCLVDMDYLARSYSKYTRGGKP